MPSGRQPQPKTAKDIPFEGFHELGDTLSKWLKAYNRYVEARRAEVSLMGYRRAVPDMDNVEAMRYELMMSHRDQDALNRDVKKQWRKLRAIMADLFDHQLFA